jgi:voltage-gated potassium channel
VESLKKLVIAFQALLVVIVIGIIGFMYLEKFNFLQAAWLTITTIFTLGYGNIIPKTVLGLYFNIFLIIIGVGLAAYTFSEFVGVIVEGKLQDVLGRREMYKKIIQLNDHIIICGAGRIGENVIERLKREKVPFMVIDKDEKIVQKLSGDGVLVMQGDATEDSVLEQAGIRKAKGLITALATDADNVFVTLTAKGINPDLLVVARAIQKESQGKLIRAGADKVISPTMIGGMRMAAAVIKPFIAEFIDTILYENEMPLAIEEIKVNIPSEIIGRELKNSGIKEKTGCLIMAIKRGKEILHNPNSNEIILEGDLLIAIGSTEQLEKLEKLVLLTRT